MVSFVWCGVCGAVQTIVQTTVCAVSNPIQWFLLCGVVFVEQFVGCGVVSGVCVVCMVCGVCGMCVGCVWCAVWHHLGFCACVHTCLLCGVV